MIIGGLSFPGYTLSGVTMPPGNSCDAGLTCPNDACTAIWTYPRTQVNLCGVHLKDLVETSLE